MDPRDFTGKTASVSFEVEKLELSCLVGQEITLYSEQFPGRELVTKVQAINQERQIQISRGGASGLIETLVNNQVIVTVLPYRGQSISVKARLKKGPGSYCYLILDKEVSPLSQRRFKRVKMIRPVKLAAFPMIQFSQKNVSRLRWLKTETEDFSSGGTRLSFSSYLEKDVYLILNIDLSDLDFPDLALAKVRHCYKTDENQYMAGLEFVVRENLQKNIPGDKLKALPKALFEYSIRDRENLNQALKNWQDYQNRSQE